MSVVTAVIMTNWYGDTVQTVLYLLKRGQSFVFSKLSTRNNAVNMTIYYINTSCFCIKLLHVSTLKLNYQAKICDRSLMNILSFYLH
jgi:hypothetical protein